jgi:hypothetical protein
MMSAPSTQPPYLPVKSYHILFCFQVDDELADIDLNDPDLNKAATKIQASFRGHKVRKEVTPKDGESGEELAVGQ